MPSKASKLKCWQFNKKTSYNFSVICGRKLQGDPSERSLWSERKARGWAFLVSASLSQQQPGEPCTDPFLSFLHPNASHHVLLHPTALPLMESLSTLSSGADSGERCCCPNLPSLAHIKMAPKCKWCGLFNLCPLNELHCNSGWEDGSLPSL